MKVRRAPYTAPVPERRLGYSDLEGAYASIGKARNWMIEGAIEGSPIVVLAGPEKRGKSWILADLVRVVVTGGKWLGTFEARVRGSAVVIENEYGSIEYARRLARLARGAGRDPAELLRKDGPIRHYCGHDLLLDEDNEAFANLLADVEEDHPAIIIIDPYRNFLVGEENSVPHNIAAMRQIARLRDAANAPVFIAHHLNRAGTMSGSRALKTRADMFIEGTDADHPKYKTIGRTIRSRDAIAKTFIAKIVHTDDDDDTIATATLGCKFEGESKTHESMTTSAKKLLAVLKDLTAPMSAKKLGDRSAISNGVVRGKALVELHEAGLVKKTDDGKWVIATAEFFRNIRESFSGALGVIQSAAGS